MTNTEYRKKWQEDNKEYLKIYREQNKEKLNKTSREWNSKNKDKVKAASKKWRDNNKQKLAENTKNWIENNKERHLKRRNRYEKTKRQKDSSYKFFHNVRICISQSFRRMNIKKSDKSEELLGCSIEFFRGYILNFNNMNLKMEDFGRFGYHIDHIIPISSARTEEDLKKLCHYTNLQPLWWKDNLKKHNKI